MRKAFAAFGLIALLLVVVIILILYFGVGGNGGAAQQAAQTRNTARDLQVELNTSQLTLLMVTYQQSAGKLPSTFEEMEAPRSSYTDPWGNLLTFTIARDPRTGRTTVTYLSAGPDGEPGTDDDVRKTDDLPV